MEIHNEMERWKILQDELKLKQVSLKRLVVLSISCSNFESVPNFLYESCTNLIVMVRSAIQQLGGIPDPLHEIYMNLIKIIENAIEQFESVPDYLHDSYINLVKIIKNAIEQKHLTPSYKDDKIYLNPVDYVNWAQKYIKHNVYPSLIVWKNNYLKNSRVELQIENNQEINAIGVNNSINNVDYKTIRNKLHKDLLEIQQIEGVSRNKYQKAIKIIIAALKQIDENFTGVKLPGSKDDLLNFCKALCPAIFKYINADNFYNYCNDKLNKSDRKKGRKSNPLCRWNQNAKSMYEVYHKAKEFLINAQ